MTINIAGPFELLDPDTPLVFKDGNDIYGAFQKQYETHKKGFFILAPSGAGKTHFIKNQDKNEWIDGDDLWQATNAHPNNDWWLESLEAINEIDARCDVVTQQAKKLGFWILGASNLWLAPDAIVIPDWETHKSWIKHREETNYDGGAKSDALEGVQSHRAAIEEWAKRGVPKFETVGEAAEYLTSSL